MSEHRECTDCQGSGESRAYRLVKGPVGKLLWGDAAKDPAASRITGYLAGRAPREPIGHDSLDQWNAVEWLGELAGLPDHWEACPTCGGSGDHPDDREAESE